MSDPNDQQNSNSLDVAGITMSALCAAHCLLLPVLGSLLPSLTQLLEFEWVHLGLLTVLIPSALVSFISRKRLHRNPKPLVLGCGGIFFLVAGVSAEGVGSGLLETALTLSGSCLLIFAHYLNFKSEIMSSKVPSHT